MSRTNYRSLKLVTLVIMLTIFANQLLAQTATTGIFFQAVARDNYSNPAKERKIYVQSTIIQTTTNGTSLLVEQHQVNTDGTGMFSISIGNGTRVGGAASGLNAIDWSQGPFYLNLKIAITPVAGNVGWDFNKEWIDIGTTSFGAVPYALYSANAGGVNQKLSITDTTKMLAVYAKSQAVQALSTTVDSKLSAKDTLTMLAPYAKAAYVLDSAYIKAQLKSKMNIADSTAAYVTPTTLNTAINSLVDAGTLSGTTLNSTVTGSSLTSVGTITSGVWSGSAIAVANGGTGLTSAGTNGQILTATGSGTLTWTTMTGGGSVVPYTGATGAVDLGAYDLTVNGLTVGRGTGSLSSNTAIGSSVLLRNTTGTSNTASGYNTLVNNTTGSNNTVNGSGALFNNTLGNSNTAIGYNVLGSNTTGNSNTAIGESALYSNTTGNSNTANGAFSLYRNTNGCCNTANGFYSLYSNTTGTQNTANGFYSLYSNTTGSTNTANGYYSLRLNTIGNYNTANGYYSLYSNTTGSSNTAIGYSSLTTNTTGSNNTAIGYNAGVASNNLTNATAIGNGAIVTASNTIQLGNTNVTNVNTSGTLTAGTVTYPNTDGTSGQVLSTTGSGTLTWTTASVPAAAAGSLTGNILASNVVSSSLTSVGTLTNTTISGKATVGASTASSASAVLEANSTTQGFLPPRMTSAQKKAISSPATGLMIYCTDCGVYGEPEYYNGTSWLNINGSSAAAGPVVIGTQKWMEKNLDVSTYRNGDTIPQVTDATAWKTLTTGAWCYYNNDSLNGAIYGKLYNWYAVNDPRGLAPQGFHIPTIGEWFSLGDFLGGNSVAGGKMKTTGTTRWNSPNTGATNESGFAGLPGGNRREDTGSFVNNGTFGFWWSSTEFFSNGANYIRLQNFSTGIYGCCALNLSGAGDKLAGYSVRCIKD
jgi:uncharacterized protein (TIGR02145 family)